LRGKEIPRAIEFTLLGKLLVKKLFAQKRQQIKIEKAVKKLGSSSE
jgi:hypothetical protein